MIRPSVSTPLESKVNIHHLINSQHIGIWQLDENAKVIFVNEFLSHILGFSAEEMLGRNALDFLPPDIASESIKILDERSKGTSRQYERIVYNSRNEKFHLLIQPTLIFDGNIYKGSIATVIDITDLKKDQEKRIIAEGAFRAIIENSTDTISLISKDGKVLYVSPIPERLAGYSSSDFIGKEIDWSFFHPDDVHYFKDAFNGVLQYPDKTYNAVYRYKNSSGDFIWIDANLKNLISEPRVQAVVLNYRDITHQKIAEEELKKTEQRYKKAEEQGKLGHWQRNLETNELIWSDELYRIFDIELYKKITVDDFLRSVHPEDLEKLKLKIDTAFKTGNSFKIKHRIIKRNGSIAYIQEFAELTKNKSGQISLFTGIAQDITQQVEIEQQLKTNEEQLRLIFESTINPMWLLNVEEGNKFRCEQANNAYCKATGITKNLLIGKRIDEIPELNNISAITDKYSEVVKTRKVSYITTTVNLPTGNMDVEMTIVPIKDSEGNVTQILGLAVDVTERKRYEDRLVAKNKALKDLTFYLQKVREEERIRMAREIHDELGQQLTGIKMDISWLNKKLSITDELQKIKIEGLFQLIDNTINTVRRIASELRPSILDDLGLNEAFKWQINEFTNRNGIPVNFFSEVKDEKFSHHITTALFRIFQETLTNIARHSRATQVFCEFKKLDNNLILIVKDNGVGFNINKKDKIKSLGLLGMKERVEMLNGKYEIVSSENKGTTISVSFPLN